MDKVTLGIYEKAFPERLELKEMLSIAKELGYDFFELSIDRTDERINRVYDSKECDKILKAISETSFPIDHINLSALAKYTLGNIDETIRNKGIEIFKKTVLFAKKIGCRLIQIPAYDMPKFENRSDETDNLFRETLKSLIEFASKEGILIALENMENEFGDTVEKCSNICDFIDSPYLQLFPDSGNITNASKQNDKSILEDMKTGKGRYLAFHLKEVRENKYGGLFYGEGIVCFPELLKYAYSIGVRRFSLEYWCTDESIWKENMIKAKELFISWLEVLND